MKNDIAHDLGDGCTDTAIVRVYNDRDDMIEIEITKGGHLSVCICPSEATMERHKRTTGGEMIVLTKEQEQLVLEQLAARAGYALVRKTV